MAYSLYTQSFGSAFANCQAFIVEASTNIPATILASASGGVVTTSGYATLDGSGNLSVYIDTAKTWNIQVFSSAVYTGLSRNSPITTALNLAPLNQVGSSFAILNAAKTGLRDPAGGADILFSTLGGGSTSNVPAGGTGATSFTAYGPIFGGSTSTSALQSTSPGVAGQFLISNGPSSVPSFQNFPTLTTLSIGGDISAPAWTTNGIGIAHASRTLTDTTSSGTVSAQYTNVLGGNTIAATNATTYTNYGTLFLADPVAGTNVTMTNKWSLWAAGSIRAAAGTKTLQGLRLGTTAGIYSRAGTLFCISDNVTEAVAIDAGGVLMRSSMSLQWSSSDPDSGGGDVRLWRDAANILAQRNATAAQEFRVYNTFTDASNYERGVFKWSSNALTIATENAGTGAGRSLFLKAGSGPAVELTPSGTLWTGDINIGGNWAILNSGQWRLGSAITLAFTGSSAATSADVGIRRNAAGLLEINDGTAGNLRDLLARDITLNAGTVTTAVSPLLITETRNAAGVTFPGIVYDVTDTASGSQSRLLDLKIAGTSVARVDRLGGAFFPYVSGNGWNIDSNGLSAKTATLTLGTITTGQSPLTITETRNAAGIAFPGISYNVTNTASHSASTLLNLQADGYSVMALRHAGNGGSEILRIQGSPTATYTEALARFLGAGPITQFLVMGSGLNRGVLIGNGGVYGFANATHGGITVDDIDVALRRNAAGVIEVNNGTAGTFRDLTLRNMLMSGDTSAAAWTTNGIGLRETARTLTDTSSTGTVALAGTHRLGGNTIAASSATTYSDYATAIFNEPTAGANVTMTRRWSLWASGGVRASFATFGPLAIGGDNGWFRVFNDNIPSGYAFGVSSAGVLAVPSNGGGLFWQSFAGGGTTSLALLQDASNTLAQRNGTAAQTFNIYNTFTDASNYERGFVRWNANVFQVGTDSVGTGSGRWTEVWAQGGARIVVNSDTTTVTTKFAAGANSAYLHNQTNGWLIAMGTSGSALGTVGGFLNTTQFAVHSAGQYSWTSTSFGASQGGATVDTAMSRNAAGVVEINNGTAGQLRDLLARDITLNAGTVTTAVSPLLITETRNAAGVTFPGVAYTVTDTASANGSTVVDFRTSTTSLLGIIKQAGISANHYLDLFGGAKIWNRSGSVGLMGSGGFPFNGVEVSTYLGFSTSGGTTFNAADTYLYRDGAANTLAQRNGTSAQEFRIYNTWTDASNYERGVLRWASNALSIGSEAAGTGTARDVNFVRGGVTQLSLQNFAVVATGSLIAGNAAAGSGSITSTGLAIHAIAQIRSGGAGIIGLYNWSANDFDRLQFGGTTSSFPALKRVSATLQARLADDSNFANLQVGALTLNGGLFEMAPIADSADFTFTSTDNWRNRAPTVSLTYTINASTGWNVLDTITVALPTTGTITFSPSGGATINGGTTPVTRTMANNVLGTVVVSRIQGTNAYAVSGA